jgi:ribonuclease E
MKRMLINATHAEELRVALVDGQRLYDLDVENRSRESKKANIYKGKVTRVEPSLEAAFVDYGSERHGFLPLKEISREYMQRSDGGRFNIKDVKVGTEVIVQVDKEERGSKGAALTTFISLAGRYLVLMPNNPRAGGISRRIDGDDRAELKDALSELEIPDGMGIIVRTAGIGRSPEELQWDLSRLIQIWDSIKVESDNCQAPHFLFQESNVIIRAVRDYLRDDIGEVIVDNEVEYQLAQAFIGQVMPPAFQNRVKLYNDSTPLFNRYQVESQIETAYQREVKLPSGGSIVIDVTEALISIDINSSRATKGGDIEETALNTNLEAADEIARQLRIRDIGGLIVIDFIDMNSTRNQKEVEKRLEQALESDRARVQVGRISRFGLLEMSRQRLRPSLAETSGMVCPQCMGQGSIRDTKSVALSILRLVEEEAIKERSGEIRAVAPISVATFLLNEKRHAIREIELRNDVRVTILPNADMVLPHFDVLRLRDDDEDLQTLSYNIELGQDEQEAEDSRKPKPPVRPNTPAVQNLSPATPAPQRAERIEKEGPGLLAKISSMFGSLFNGEEEVEEKPDRSNDRNRNSTNANRNNDRNNNRNRNRNNNRSNTRDNRNRSDSRGNRDNTRESNREENRDGRSGGRNRDNSRNNNRDQNRGSQRDNQTDNAKERSDQRNSNRRQRNGRSQRPERNEQQTAESAARSGAQHQEAAGNQLTEQQESRQRPERNQSRARNSNRPPRGSQRPLRQDGSVTESSGFVPMADIASAEYEAQQKYHEQMMAAEKAQQQHPAPTREHRPAPSMPPEQETVPAQKSPTSSPVNEATPITDKPSRKPGERAGNDPRIAPKAERAIEIMTEKVERPVPVIPTELAPTNTVERARPGNDPRAKRVQPGSEERSPSTGTEGGSE